MNPLTVRNGRTWNSWRTWRFRRTRGSHAMMCRTLSRFQPWRRDA